MTQAAQASRPASQYMPKMHLPNQYAVWNNQLTPLEGKSKLSPQEKTELSQLVRVLTGKNLRDEISNQRANLNSQGSQGAHQIPDFTSLIQRANDLSSRVFPNKPKSYQETPRQRSVSSAPAATNQGQTDGKTSDVQARALPTARRSSSTNDGPIAQQSLPRAAQAPQTPTNPQLPEQTSTQAQPEPRPSVDTVRRVFTEAQKTEESEFVHIPREKNSKKITDKAKQLTSAQNTEEGKDPSSSTPPSPPLNPIHNAGKVLLQVEEPPSSPPADSPPAPPSDAPPPAREYVAPRKPPEEEPSYFAQAYSAGYDLVTSLFSRRS